MGSLNEQIKKLKRELLDRYIILMLTILIIYVIIFIFYIPDPVIPYYLSGGVVFVFYSYVLMRKRFSMDVILHSYLITAPLFTFYISLSFWNTSVASFCWLLPVPLAAYIFFTKKEVMLYSLYTLLIITLVYISANNFSFDFPVHSQKEVLLTDVLLIISNILIITLLIYYKDKIKKLEILAELEKNLLQTEKVKKSTVENDVDEKDDDTDDIDAENMEKLFHRIEIFMSEKKPYKDAKFNLSSLSVAMRLNSSYLSKAIRYKGYSNFNNYLNIYRINNVKELLTEVDFQKTTLMYVYSEAGFSNQSTFNRVFKQIEGTTPSEYIQKNVKTTNESNV